MQHKLIENKNLDKFIWFDKKHKFNWKLLLQLLITNGIIFGIETLSYFYVATWAGKMFDTINPNYTLNLQLPFDALFPWISWLFPFYIVWPFVWFVVLPALVYLNSGKKAYYRYIAVSFAIYMFSFFLYTVIPTTCSPAEFMTLKGTPDYSAYVNGPQINPANGIAFGGIYKENNLHYHLLKEGDLFYNNLFELANDPRNIWGSSPSFHNFWASLLVFYGLHFGKKWWLSIIMVVLGLTISTSTLGLHQHNIADVLITYSMSGVILLLIHNTKWDVRVEKGLDKMFKVKLH